MAQEYLDDVKTAIVLASYVRYARIDSPLSWAVWATGRPHYHCTYVVVEQFMYKNIGFYCGLPKDTIFVVESFERLGLILVGSVESVLEDFVGVRAAARKHGYALSSLLPRELIVQASIVSPIRPLGFIGWLEHGAWSQASN